MKNMQEKLLNLFAPQCLKNKINELEQKKRYKEWEENACPTPPPHLAKQKAIKEYQQKYGVKVFVETGTYLGDMIEAQKGNFERLISIELGVELSEKAKKRFKKHPQITILQGDSGKVLPKVVADLNEPAIFWLDGHYSAGITAKGDTECPIFEELNAIFSDKKNEHIILIDDARCFVGQGDYPSIEELTAFIKTKNDRYKLEVKHDIIRYVI